jgi:hypothetical protein
MAKETVQPKPVTPEWRGKVAAYNAEHRLVILESDGQTSHTFNLGGATRIHPSHLKFSSLTGADVTVVGFELDGEVEAILVNS